MSRQALDTSKNQNYESDDDYQTESDSEYEDITISGWGDNAKKEATWDTLIDPSVKVKAGGIGSGDLHRRGGNFKPLSEAAILAQRLSKGVPSKKSSKPKKPKKKKPSGIAPPKPVTTFGRVNRPYIPATFRPSAPMRAPIKDPSASTWGSIPLSDTPFWEKKQDSPKPTTTIPATTTPTPTPMPSFNQPKSTVPQLPFFEFKAPNISQQPKATHEPVDSKSFVPNSIQNNTSWGSKEPIQIEYSLLNPPNLTPKTKTLTSQQLPSFSVAPAEESPSKETNNQPAIANNTTAVKWNIGAQGFTPITVKADTSNKWNVSAQGFTPISKAETTLKWNADVPSFVPSTASTSTASSAHSPIPGPAIYNADAPIFVPTFVPPPPVKKILKITSPHADTTTINTTTTATTTPTSTTQHLKSRVHLDQSLLRRHLDIKPSTAAAQQTQPEKPHTTANTTTITTTTTTKEHQHQDHQLESQTQPESTRGFEREPFLRIHLEISEGISTSILVEEGSNPESLAEEFGINHKLKMTPKAKTNMAAFIARLIDEKKNKAKHDLMD